MISTMRLQIKSVRHTKDSEGARTASDVEYYITFYGEDRRNDRWVVESEL